MIVSELIELLQDADPEAEVLVAHQPGWPLQHTVHGVYDAADHEQACDEHDAYECDECDSPPVNDHVYLVASDSHPEAGPYAPRDAWDGARTS
jgi:hypothetical protein